MIDISQAAPEAEEHRLRKAELAAHGSSIVAVVLTVLMVGSKQASEANPVAAWLISHGGISTWALVSPILVALGFGTFRAAARGFSAFGREIDGHAGAARLSAWVVVAALALDAVGNLVATGLHGLPDSAPYLDLLQLAGALVAIASVLILRRELLEAKRALSERVACVRGGRVAVVVFSLLLVTAGLGGITFVNPDYSAVGNASAASSGIEVAFQGGNGNLQYTDANGDTVDLGRDAGGVGGVEDFDGDGDLDILYEDVTTGTINYIDASGNRVDLGVAAKDLLGGVGDFDGDGDPDLAYRSTNAYLHYVDSSGADTNTSIETTELGGMGDMDGDGDLDVVYEDTNTNLKYVDGAGTVTTITSYDAHIVGPIHDFDGDGDMDVMTQDQGDFNIKGIDVNGNIHTVRTDGGGRNTMSDEVADLDGDGDVDVATDKAYPDNGNLQYIDWAGNVGDPGVTLSTYVGGMGDLDGDKKRPVSGTVSDSDGDPISGATISDGAGNSTTTASDGTYTLDLQDGTYTLTASKSGYLNESQQVTVDGSPVTGVDYKLVGQLRGFVKDAESGSVIDGATVETDGGTSDTTNATGFYSLPLADGDYSVSASGPDHGSESRDVTVAGATTANYSLCPSIGCGYYEQTFVLEDYTGEFYENGPSLFIYKFKGGDISEAKSIISDGENTDDWEYENTRGFNHANESFYDLENHHYYAFIVVNEDAVDLSQTRGVYETGPYLANETNGPKTLQIGRPANETNTSEACSIFTSDDNGLELICSGENPVSEFDFGITMPDGSIYDDSISFDSPQDYYEGELPQDVLDNYTNSTSAAEDVVIDYSGTWENGSSFNGTSSLLGSTGGGSQSFFGPTGKSGGGAGGIQRVGGYALLAGGALLAYRRFGNGSITESASSAVSRLRGRR